MTEQAGNERRASADIEFDEALASRIEALITELQDVINRVSAQGNALCKDWDRVIADDGFRASALNLAHYLALRQLDLADIQPALSELGLSSLGRSEGHVLASLAAVLASLTRLAGRPAPDYPARWQWDEPSRLLHERKRDLFGGDDGPAIMVTLPSEAAQDPKLVRSLVRTGMDCARINCAHDDAKAWDAMVRNVSKAAAAEGRSCRILMDLGGPKLRIASVQPEKPGRLHAGDRFALVAASDAAPIGMPSITISLPEILPRLTPGMPVWINDGKIRSRIIDRLASGFVLEIVGARAKGEKLRPEKGVNIPGADLGLAPLTEEDRRDLDFVAAHADLVGFSFVQKPSDIDDLDRELEARRPGRPLPPIVLKIETGQAVRNLPRLIVRAAGRRPAAVMIARGDLAVDLGFGRMAEIQEEILWLCEAASLPVIWATQVLDDLVRDGLPSRAEATDAAMAQRAECVMLNKGPHLAEAIGFLADIASRMDRHQSKKSARFGPLHSWPLEALLLEPQPPADPSPG